MKSALSTLVLIVFSGTVHGQYVPPDHIPKFDQKLLEPYRVVVPVTEKEPTLEELVAQIMKIREEKAALQKKEQELIAQLRAKVAKQTELLNKLGLGDQVPFSVPLPPGASRPGGSDPSPIIPSPGAAPPIGSTPSPGGLPAVGTPPPGGSSSGRR